MFMPRKSFNDATYFKHDKIQKKYWKMKAGIDQESKEPDLSAWMRDQLDFAAGLSLPKK